jgi:ribosomal protein S6--L-glutamate ligase
MKLYFMLAYARRKADRSRLMAEVIANLMADGFEVAIGVAELLAVSPESLRVEADLYILKSKSSLWLNLAAVLDAQHARILNSVEACVATANKIRSSSRLHAAQVPIPRSWVTADLALIPEVTDAMPLLLKPNIGRDGVGIHLVRDRAELDTIRINDGMLIQELITPIEEELKLYVVGDSVYGVRKHRDSGERVPVAVEPVIRDIARRCGRALGLQIYGVDVLISTNGPVVVDVNYFPSFRGVRDVARPISEYIRACVRQ